MILPNLILPLIFEHLALTVVGFIPVVLIEAAVLAGILGRRWSTLVWPVAVVNAVSSSMGLPLLALAHYGAHSWGQESGMRGWIGSLLDAFDYPPQANPTVAIVAIALGLLLLFALSSLVEGWLLSLFWGASRTGEPARLRRASWGMNAVSYAVLLGFTTLVWA